MYSRNQKINEASKRLANIGIQVQALWCLAHWHMQDDVCDCPCRSVLCPYAMQIVVPGGPARESQRNAPKLCKCIDGGGYRCVIIRGLNHDRRLGRVIGRQVNQYCGLNSSGSGGGLDDRFSLGRGGSLRQRLVCSRGCCLSRGSESSVPQLYRELWMRLWWLGRADRL
jgi:hypothetical protein